MSGLSHRGLDHVAIVVENTDRALQFWREKLGLKVIASEEVNGATVRLTHLDLGNTQIQLVEPLTSDHPLKTWLEEHGPGLHHICFRVEDVDEVSRDSTIKFLGQPHEGVGGKRAQFADRTDTQNILVEVTGR